MLNWYEGTIALSIQEINPYLAIEAKLAEYKGFDGGSFYRALKGAVTTRQMTWKQVAEVTGVSASTLARMAQGRYPDASSLAALSAWAGLNPSDFVDASFKPPAGESIGRISSLLRSDPCLDSDAADALDAIIRTAYEQLRKPES